MNNEKLTWNFEEALMINYKSIVNMWPHKPLTLTYQRSFIKTCSHTHAHRLYQDLFDWLSGFISCEWFFIAWVLDTHTGLKTVMRIIHFVAMQVGNHSANCIIVALNGFQHWDIDLQMHLCN